MSKRKRALGLVATAAAMLTLQAAAVRTAVLHVDEFLVGRSAIALAHAGQRVASAVTHNTTANSDAIAENRIDVVANAPAMRVVKIDVSDLGDVSTLEGIELPEPTPLEVQCPEAASSAGAIMVKLDDCDPNSCTIVKPAQRVVTIAKAKAAKRTKATVVSEWSSNEDEAAPTARDERTRDRERERESRHESAIGPLKPAALGSVW